jgi:hypothetical protein
MLIDGKTLFLNLKSSDMRIGEVLELTEDTSSLTVNQSR